MATVIFYEKPGCINNTKQKSWLKAAGHTVDDRNLLTEAWTAQRLQAFFGQRPVVEWFNYTAPLIKSGEVVPAHLDSTTALQLMIQHPLLIRRPLIQSGDRYTVGFDVPELESWLGLSVPSQQVSSQQVPSQQVPSQQVPSQQVPSQQTIYDDWRHQNLEVCPRSR